jgi:hypothetical protein
MAGPSGLQRPDLAGDAIYLLRTRGGYLSLPHFLVSKYGAGAAKLFMILVTFRLVNEIWSNTKVMSLYFGSDRRGAGRIGLPWC